MTGCDSTPTRCLVTGIETLATTYVVPADLTAALWRAPAAQADLVSLGTTTDRLGTPVQAIAYTGSPGTLEVLLISTRTGQLTGSETVTLHSDTLHIATPTVTAFTAIQQTGWVTTVGSP